MLFDERSDLGSKECSDLAFLLVESGCSFDEHSDLGSEECSNSRFSLDEFNFNEAINGGIVSEEFFLKQVGRRLQGYFQNEFDNLLGMSPLRAF